MTWNSSWSHIEKFLLLIHAFPFKWSAASIIFLIFIRCGILPSSNHGLFLLFLLILFYFLTLEWKFWPLFYHQFLSEWLLHCHYLLWWNSILCDPCKYLTIPFVLKKLSSIIFKYFSAVLLLPAWNLQYFPECESSIKYFFLSAQSGQWIDHGFHMSVWSVTNSYRSSFPGNVHECAYLQLF